MKLLLIAYLALVLIGSPVLGFAVDIGAAVVEYRDTPHSSYPVFAVTAKSMEEATATCTESMIASSAADVQISAASVLVPSYSGGSLYPSQYVTSAASTAAGFILSNTIFANSPISSAMSTAAGFVISNSVSAEAIQGTQTSASSTSVSLSTSTAFSTSTTSLASTLLTLSTSTAAAFSTSTTSTSLISFLTPQPIIIGTSSILNSSPALSTSSSFVTSKSPVVSIIAASTGVSVSSTSPQSATFSTSVLSISPVASSRSAATSSVVPSTSSSVLSSPVAKSSSTAVPRSSSLVSSTVVTNPSQLTSTTTSFTTTSTFATTFLSTLTTSIPVGEASSSTFLSGSTSNFVEGISAASGLSSSFNKPLTVVPSVSLSSSIQTTSQTLFVTEQSTLTLPGSFSIKTDTALASVVAYTATNPTSVLGTSTTTQKVSLVSIYTGSLATPPAASSPPESCTDELSSPSSTPTVSETLAPSSGTGQSAQETTSASCELYVSQPGFIGFQMSRTICPSTNTQAIQPTSTTYGNTQNVSTPTDLNSSSVYNQLLGLPTSLIAQGMTAASSNTTLVTASTSSSSSLSEYPSSPASTTQVFTSHGEGSGRGQSLKLAFLVSFLALSVLI